MGIITAERRINCLLQFSPNLRFGHIVSYGHNRDTSIEITLRKALWQKDYRYRKNYSAFPGKPDIALTKHKIAVFCDSDFFHGKDWHTILRPRLLRGAHPEFWEKKILRNMERDKENNLLQRADRLLQYLFVGNDLLLFIDIRILVGAPSGVVIQQTALHCIAEYPA